MRTVRVSIFIFLQAFLHLSGLSARIIAERRTQRKRATPPAKSHKASDRNHR